MSLNIAYGGLYKIISGGQTGADQGGLIAAWRQGIETGGTAPRFYQTQGGFNPLLEVLNLTAEGDYKTRTKCNAKDADATVIIAHNPGSGGTRLTLKCADEAGKPTLLINVIEVVRNTALGVDDGQIHLSYQAMCEQHALVLYDFIKEYKVGILNVAGNREIQASGNEPDKIMIMTTLTDCIVSCALEMLAGDNLLIRRNRDF